jgi:cytochrome c peroxidase
MNSRTPWLLGAGLLALAGAFSAVETQGLAETQGFAEIQGLAETQGLADATPVGVNPHPVHLMRPAVAPLSAMAQLGKLIFYDASLSSSGALSCASCHSPDRAYGPSNDGPVMLGGAAQSRQGARAVPSLTYLERHPVFSIGPDKGDDDHVIDLAQMAAVGQQAARATKTAGGTAASAANIVPQGGLFWDGRADTLQDQALFPLLDPNEMDGGSAEVVADKLRHAAYAPRFAELFGPGVFANQHLLIAEAMFAVARYQVEEESFHPYTSKYDYWLEGRARLSESELRGLQVFNDPDKANCAGCHTSAPTLDGLPPLFTDHQYEALGAPRNAALAGNRDPGHFDLGVCGPQRTDVADQTQYCGMFLTPTLRNTATRRAFFHNGVFSSLEQVLDFYNFRDTNPEKVYPRAADGAVRKYDDLPAKYHANVDVSDPPFDRRPGDTPAMSAQDEADIIAFMKTLTDGYQPEH